MKHHTQSDVALRVMSAYNEQVNNSERPYLTQLDYEHEID